MVLLNWQRSVNGPLVKQLGDAGVCFDIATLEGVGGIAQLVAEISARQVMFGSHSPLFYFASTELKLIESGLEPEQTAAVRNGKARRFLQTNRRP